MDTLGKRLRSLRQGFRLSLSELSKMVDVDISQASLSNIENDKQKPTSDVIIALASFFKVSNDWLLTGREFIKQEKHIELTRELYESMSSPVNSLSIIRDKIEKLQSDLNSIYNVFDEVIDNASNEISSDTLEQIKDDALKEINALQKNELSND